MTKAQRMREALAEMEHIFMQAAGDLPHIKSHARPSKADPTANHALFWAEVTQEERAEAEAALRMGLAEWVVQRMHKDHVGYLQRIVRVAQAIEEGEDY